jgi:hypothetical protein
MSLHATVSTLVGRFTRDESRLCELEVRIGQFNVKGYFVPGFQAGQKATVARLLKRLQTSCALNPLTWTEHPQVIYLRSFYDHNVRRTHYTDPPRQVTETKLKLETVEVQTDRPYQLRFCLSQESPLLDDVSLRNTEVSAVQFVQRASFVELVHVQGKKPVKFQYDVSKVSPRAKDKASSAGQLCTYHFEVELLRETANGALSHSAPQPTNEEITDLLLSRCHAMLGTHEAATHEPLAQPRFTLRAPRKGKQKFS